MCIFFVQRGSTLSCANPVGLPIIGTFFIVATIYLIKVGDKGTHKRGHNQINLFILML